MIGALAGISHRYNCPNPTSTIFSHQRRRRPLSIPLVTGVAGPAPSDPQPSLPLPVPPAALSRRGGGDRADGQKTAPLLDGGVAQLGAHLVDYPFGLSSALGRGI